MERKSRSARLSRREALGLIGVGAGVGLVTAFSALRGESPLVAAALQTGTQTAKSPIPRGAIVRTILRDLSPDAVGNGHILFHEHMSFGAEFFEKMRPANVPRPTTPIKTYLDDVDLVTEEVKASGKDGISLIVDGGHADMATSYAHLRRVAGRSGVHSAASGGYYLQLTYPPQASKLSEEQ